MAVERIFDIQGFEGGEGDDIYRSPKNGFYSGENIEVRKNLSGVQLTPALTDTGWVFDDNICYIVSLKTLGVDSGGIVVCTENGKVYLDGTLKTTLTGDSKLVVGIGVNYVGSTQYVYYVGRTSIGNGYIHRSTTNLGTFNIEYQAYTTGTKYGAFAGLINQLGLLYIAVNNKVFIYDNTEVLTEYLALPAKEVVKGFTQFQNIFKIYTNQENTGVQYVWDGASEAPDYRQEWINQPILGVVNNGAFDYATLGFNENYSDLYLISGTQKQVMRVNLEAAPYSRLLTGYLSIREDIVYISGGKTGQSANYGVYSYGNYYPGTPKSLIQSYSGTTSAFLMHTHIDTTSYFACANDKVYTISQNNPPTSDVYASSGYVVSNIYQGNLWENKDFKQLKAGFKLNGGQIDIYCRTTMSLTSETAWKLVKSITNASYGSAKMVRVSKDEILSLGLGEFQEFQLKFVLTKASGDTPVLSRVTTWFTIVND